MPEEMQCSFCGKPRKEVNHMIKGARGYICDSCVEKAVKVVVAQQADAAKDDITELVPPKEIRAYLDDYVIGQDGAKIALAVAVFNHYMRLFDARKDLMDDVEIEKDNIMMLGPTGCGKTLLAKSVARFLNVPFTIADATSLTEAGFVGDDVEDIISALVMKCGGDIRMAERGIVFIDEIDKIASRNTSNTMTRDVRGEGVQQALLKLIEGTTVQVPMPGNRRIGGGERYEIDTTNILFIVSGAFVGLDEVISKRVNKKGNVGFGIGSKTDNVSDESDLMGLVTTADLKMYGFIPEFLGRIPVIVALSELTEEELVFVLTEPRNAITKQFIKRFEIGSDVKLTFTEDALKAIAHKAIDEGRGARGLRSIINPLLRDLEYNLPSERGQWDEVIITAEVVRGEADPELIPRKSVANA